jgi:hypothetical protein
LFIKKKRRRERKEKSCAKEIFESIKCCKHPLIALGATSIRSADRAPDKIRVREEAKKVRW